MYTSSGSWLVVVVFSFAVSPGTWPGGAWVPGGPRPGFAVCFYHDLVYAQVDSFQVFFTCFTCKMGIAPIRESCIDFHFLILEWWTNRTRLHEPTACEQKKNPNAKRKVLGIYVWAFWGASFESQQKGFPVGSYFGASWAVFKPIGPFWGVKATGGAPIWIQT